MDRIAWLRYLARTVPAARLARVAAGRVRRAAGRGREEPPTQEAILAAFQASHLGLLPKRMAAPVPGLWSFASPPGLRSAARFLVAELPAEAEAQALLAEEALAGRCRIFGREVDLPRCERRVPEASARWRAIDWEAIPGGDRDPRFAWAAGRLEAVVHLACGAAIAEARGDGALQLRCADAALDRIVDIAGAPRGVQWSCPMEVALRAANIAIALRILAGSGALERRPDAACAALRTLRIHQRHVEANLEELVVVPNNHLVADLVGVAVVGALWPRLPGAAAAARRALVRLEEEVLVQTLPDGFSFEGSVAYHRLAVELFTLGHLAAIGLSAPFGPAARDRIAAMYGACSRLIDGRGLSPGIGDDDGGFALPFGRHRSLDQRRLLALGEALFGRSEPGRTPPDATFVWLLGPAAARRVAARRAPEVAGDAALPAGGIFLLRSRRLSCAVACGPNGTGGTGTHGHNDKLAVEICVDGRVVAMDPGTGSYTGDPALRQRLRSTAAHNTVRVEGEEQQPFPEGRLFALPEVAHARCLQFVSGPRIARFVGEHRGYLRLRQRVVHRREVSLDREAEVLRIRDRLDGAGRDPIRAEVRWLVPAGPLRIRPATPRECRRIGGGIGAAWAVEIGPHDGPLAILVGAGASAPPRIEPGVVATGYGETAHALHVCFPLAGRLPKVFQAALLPIDGVAGRGEEAGSYVAA